MLKIRSTTCADGKLGFYSLIMYQIAHQLNETENQVTELIKITIKQIHTYLSIEESDN